MISYFKNLKIVNKKQGSARPPAGREQAGMTYVELIVVLSIFAVMSAVAMFNYGEFQANVDIKNLASDIALKIVEAQRTALSGQLPPSDQYHYVGDPNTWKPSYGVYFDSSSNPVGNIYPNKQFIYFADVSNIITDPQNRSYDGEVSCNGECLDRVTITKNNIISKLEVFGDSCLAPPGGNGGKTMPEIANLSIVFERPDSSAKMSSSGSLLYCDSLSYVQITIRSPKTASAKIKIYPSGRIQVN